MQIHLIDFMVIVILLQPLIISVEENETVLDDTPDNLGIEAVCMSAHSISLFK